MKKSNSIVVKVLVALVVLVGGVLWLISGIAESFQFGFSAFWPTLLVGFGIVFALCAFYEKSAGYAFIFSLFFVHGVLFLLSAYSNYNSALYISVTWPFIFLSIAFGAMFLTLDNQTNVKFHAKNAILFTLTTVFLYLGNISILSWAICIPVVVLATGVSVLIDIISNRNKTEDDDIYETEDYASYEQKKNEKV